MEATGIMLHLRAIPVTPIWILASLGGCGVRDQSAADHVERR